ncbi:hypothetical protein RBU13_23940, partial [Pseudomonas aeruginosa]
MTPTTGKSKFRTLRPWLITALAFAAVIGLVMWLAAPASPSGRCDLLLMP